MPERKLFYAKGVMRTLVHIDRVKKHKKDLFEYFCPFCGDKVFPKMGEKKVWHFAHASGHACSKSEREEMNNMKLMEFAKSDKVKMIDVADIEIGDDCPDYQCEVCGKIGNKRYAQKFKGNRYMCNSCYKSFDPEEINRL
ncbi:hypothetical protein GF371_01250 [Candidatus Woesearchaeota archaeon]|nr:hypothetical protein [Candidatus Woesearchaeota archaeon]